MSFLSKPRNVSAASPYPHLPRGRVIYAIGDIHGRWDLLQRVFARIDEDTRERAGERDFICEEIYLGDFINRGPQSREVVEGLLQRSRARRVRLIEANHEIMLRRFLVGDLSLEAWKAAGGLECLLSYGVDPTVMHNEEATRRAAAAAIPADHLRFLAAATPFVAAHGYVFVHAGLRPRRALARQTIDDLAWIRGDFLTHRGAFEGVVVHGHTPSTEAELLANRINLDTGAYVTNRLTLLRIDENGVALPGGAS